MVGSSAIAKSGQGPGIIAVNGGGMQAAQNLMKLAHALADSFTVYLPDRRGRELSGPPGSHYSLATECEDLSPGPGHRRSQHLRAELGGHYRLAGCSRPAAIRKAALCEPPLLVNHSAQPADWPVLTGRSRGQASVGRDHGDAGNSAPAVLCFMPRIALGHR
jgi:hypothetical protein